ncbi:uncharacterized protein Pyn_30626 [Prunus yedoensis var. nudiflora]|uniref:Wall-associated receptor kinase galacturonan-binding domain-containing protein n=1 Tax=Prunus yedoensis var. nudiflora TaxID=2094558 RepID=A0A314UBW5_PRUYE|nr:uncharacterized protein Pyn_30626 [Prunus yedoensis var. nudiflora]
MQIIRRATSTASSVLYSVLLIFLCFVRVQVQARYHKQANCSTSCGEIQNIKYPFRLKGDPSGCRDPDYEFSCVDDRTILEIFPGKFYVHNISNNDQILRLVDVNFANGSCSLQSGAVLSADRDVKDFRFSGFDVKFPSYGAVMELLQAGFDVRWSVECRDCSLAGKGCLCRVQRTHITSNYLNIGGNWYRSSSWSILYNSHIGGRYPQVSERTKKSSQEEAAESAMLDTNNQQFWN